MTRRPFEDDLRADRRAERAIFLRSLLVLAFLAAFVVVRTLLV